MHRRKQCLLHHIRPAHQLIDLILADKDAALASGRSLFEWGAILADKCPNALLSNMQGHERRFYDRITSAKEAIELTRPALFLLCLTEILCALSEPSYGMDYIEYMIFGSITSESAKADKNRIHFPCGIWDPLASIYGLVSAFRKAYSLL